jgi:hypothetical protein
MGVILSWGIYTMIEPYKLQDKPCEGFMPPLGFTASTFARLLMKTKRPVFETGL